MTRAKKVSVFNLVASLLIGAAAQSFICENLAWAGADDVVVAQVTSRATQAHLSLSKAIECYRQGDYENADAFFREVLARLADLTATEQEDFKRFQQDNINAMAARKNAKHLLLTAEKALIEGRNAEAVEFVKKASLSEQYMTLDDKQRLAELGQQLKMRLTPVRPYPEPSAAGPDIAPPAPVFTPQSPYHGIAPAAPAGGPTVADMDQVRIKMQQARAQLGLANFEMCEQLLLEAEALHVVFDKGEDSPARVRDELARAKADPKALLAAARSALARKDFDRAEQYAHLAEKSSGTWNLTILGDTPAKVLRDVQTIRAQTLAAANPKPTPAEKASPGVFDSVKGMFGAGSKPEQPATVEASVTVNASPAAGAPAATVPGQPDKTDMARKYVKDGRLALKNGDFVQAHKCADLALTCPAQYLPGEDNPLKLLADVANAESLAKTMPKKPARSQHEEAVELVKEGHKELSEGKLDDALKSAMKAKSLNVSWGVFEDTPDTLVSAIEKARIRHNQEESVKVLAEGRRLLEKKDYEGAMRAAYRAQTLHGTYYIWELGDRPDNLLADVEAGRAKHPRIDVPADSAVVKKDNKIPPPSAPPTTDKVTPPAVVAQGPRTGDSVQLVSGNDVKPVPPSAGTGTPPPFNPSGGPRVTPNDPVVKPAMPLDTNKVLAQRLLEEAHAFARAGDLMQARQKCLEAQKLHVTYGADEEGPAEVLVHLSRLAAQRVQSLVTHAKDLADDGALPETKRFQEAEQEMLRARELATQFGQDTQLVDGQLRWVQQHNSVLVTAATAPSAPLPNAAGPGAPMPVNSANPGVLPPTVSNDQTNDPMQQKGRELLDEARRMLRSGATDKARKLAVQASEEQYGVQQEAFAVLRSVDTEDFNQQVMEERRKFMAVVAQYNNHDFANARAMLDTVNAKALTDEQQARRKEMLQTPQMQPMSETTLVQNQNPPASVLPDNPTPVAPPPGASSVHVSDGNPQQSLLKTTEAMRVVKFQEMRTKGLQAQSTAAEQFRTGQADAALETLQTYLDSLSSEHLDAGQVAMLKRPVESRLDQFRLLKEQNELLNRDHVAAKTINDQRSKAELAKQNRDQRVADLMKQFNNLYKEHKYSEAERYALLASELDPDNGIAASAVAIVRQQMRILESEDTKNEREKMVYGAFKDQERQGPFLDIRNPENMDLKTMAQANKRVPLSFMSKRPAKVRELEAQLNTLASVHFSNTPLHQAIDDLHTMNPNINFVIENNALEKEGISPDHPVSINVEQISLRSALTILLNQVKLTYVPQNEVLTITTPENAKGKNVRCTLQVADLIIPTENSFGNVAGTATPGATPTSQLATPGTPSLGSPYSMSGGSAVGSPTGGPTSASSFGTGAPMTGVDGSKQWTMSKSKPAQTMEDHLIHLITSTVEPNSWNGMGGSGSIEYFGPTMSLVINQTVDIQEQIADLLSALRSLEDQEVAIEIRFITISDDFYERIGVDFNMNIETNKGNAKFQPSLLTNIFAPSGQINVPSFKGLISGITPAGTLTNDLSIPVNPNSFNAAVPTFGGYTPGVGGLNIGLAFLSDIQVFLFMEAVAGDVRSNVMTAPKLMLQNGQTATILVSEGNRNFLASVNYTQIGGQFVAQPIIVNIAQTGVSVSVTAVISADRRFVRLSPTLTLSNTTPGGITTVIPLQLPLYPTLTDPLFGGNGVSPVLFTQYLETPSTNTIGVATTVTVPDGGTVLMGGLKVMSEGRNEYGPPVLSQIPYLNRLFKNTSYGRDARSLMIMVTPRIVIQAEEEERATGFVHPHVEQ